MVHETICLPADLYLMFFMILFLGLISSPFIIEEKKGDLTVVMTDFRNDNGVVWIVLYNSPETFLKEGNIGFRREKGIVFRNKCIVRFKDLPYGDYAIAFIHDENSNHALDVEVPKEGFGISNDPKFISGPPEFETSKFILSKKNHFIKIKISYF
jgi:uncharacterized protein (DUF2141 family)